MEGGGAERVASLLCNRWAGEGHDVTLVPTFSGRGSCRYPLDAGVRLEYLSDRVGSNRKTPWTSLRRLAAMRGLVREAGADVVVSFLTRVNIATLLATRGLDLPVVVSERVYPPDWPVGRVLDRLRRWTYPRASAVVMQSERGVKWLESAMPKANGAVIPNPCVHPLPDSEPRVDPSEHLAPDRRVVLAAGRLSGQKGFDILIEAFAPLAARFPDWNLVIAGDGSERPALEAAIGENGLSGRVLLPGRVGNISDWYARAEFYVLSSRVEGFPNTLMEAMAHGLPVVSFDCDTGPADIVRDGVDGWLVPLAGGADGLRLAMEKLLAAGALRERMAEAAVSVRERFSPERVGADWDRLLGLVE